MPAQRLTVRTASWNMAAVNNNPFEYWITVDSHGYNNLMNEVEAFISDPARDVLVSSIFTDSMFCELMNELQEQQLSGLQELKDFWTDDYSKRMAIRGFLKDKMIGTKRLASMPDRITNTVNLADGRISTRPTVINAYDGGSLDSIDSWWQQWKRFMFHTKLQIYSGSGKSAKSPQVVCSLITPILRGKYPAISPEEQAISAQLQILCLAILDAIFVYMLNAVGASTWQSIRRELSDALIKNKAVKSCQIIAQSYRDVDVFFIQEAAAIFVQNALDQPAIQDKYHILMPRHLDGKRDQNSLILVDCERFVRTSCVDVTEQVLESIDGTWVAPGDLLVVTILDMEGLRWMLASFHGDSNGLSTQPLLAAVCDLARRRFGEHVLLMGMDANTYSFAQDAYHHSVDSFCGFLEAQQLVSLWGPRPDASLRTTCSSRTFLQTQLNKATPFAERSSIAQQNLKDWIVAYDFQMSAAEEAARDNTGCRRYVDGMVLPTLTFPSDHMIISAVFRLREARAPPPPARVEPVSSMTRKESELSQSTAQSGRPERDKTLYDYWGIGDKPMAFRAIDPAPSAASLGSGAGLLAEPAPGESAGESAEEAVQCICERQFVRLALNRHGGDLDMKKVLLAKGEDRSVWILFSSRPYSVAIQKRWFQAVVGVSGLLFFLSGVLNISEVLGVLSLQGQYFRLTPLQLRQGGADVAAPGIAGMGLLQGGCRVAAAPVNTTVVGATMMVAFNASVSLDGWWFETADQPPAADPVHPPWPSPTTA